MEKICTVCPKTYRRNVKYSNQQWKESKFCSQKCQWVGSDRTKQGGHNKGKKTAKPKKCELCSVVSLKVYFDGKYKKFVCGKHYWHIRREEKAGRPKPKNCEVCGEDSQICFDHDHKTGDFRGWLCHKCNKILGFSRDDPKLLVKLAKYLNE